MKYQQGFEGGLMFHHETDRDAKERKERRYLEGKGVVGTGGVVVVVGGWSPNYPSPE